MLSKEELDNIRCLENLTDEMLFRMLPEVEKYKFEKNDIIFKQGDPADLFYMLKKGSLLLERRISDRLTISICAIKPGYSFGWSGILPESASYTLEAICSEPCEVLAIRKKDIIEIMENDHTLGYLFTRKILLILKQRLDNRTSKLSKAIKNHPDLKALV